MMFQDFLNDLRVFNAGHDSYLAAALLTLLDRAAFGSIAKTRLSRCAHVIA
jgi:hypothetical protein